MEVGKVKIAEDSDFTNLRQLIDNHAEWKLDYDKGESTKVWTRSTPNSNFKMVKLHAVFQNITPETMFDVLHDPEYRKEWDEHMIVSVDIGYLNPNNDVGYYALSCPPPVKNRDFVLQRSWLDLGDEKYIFNHSVEHKLYPSKKGFVRGISILTGFILRREQNNSCLMGYVTQTDPRGKLPPWLVNKITQKFAPKVVKQMYKAALGYESWKMTQPDPKFKPWIYPEQIMMSQRVSVTDVVPAPRQSKLTPCNRKSKRRKSQSHSQSRSQTLIDTKNDPEILGHVGKGAKKKVGVILREL